MPRAGEAPDRDLWEAFQGRGEIAAAEVLFRRRWLAVSHELLPASTLSARALHALNLGFGRALHDDGPERGTFLDAWVARSRAALSAGETPPAEERRRLGRLVSLATTDPTPDALWDLARPHAECGLSPVPQPSAENSLRRWLLLGVLLALAVWVPHWPWSAPSNPTSRGPEALPMAWEATASAALNPRAERILSGRVCHVAIRVDPVLAVVVALEALPPCADQAPRLRDALVGQPVPEGAPTDSTDGWVELALGRPPRVPRSR